ncbi:hypothetical protein Tco_0618878 [Tanacetum coccineum]
MKREGKDFSGRVTPLFATMMVQANQEEGAYSATPTDSYSTPIITQPSSSKPQKKKSSRKQRKDSAPTKSTTKETTLEENVATPSCDPPQSETTKSNQALEIESLKRRVKSFEKRRKSRTPGFKRLRKVRSASWVESSNDANVLEEQEKDVVEKEVSVVDSVTTAGEVITIANVEVTTINAPTTTIDELTLAQTLIEIKVAKPKVSKDKGKGIMVEPEVSLKKKDQVALDEEIARNLEAQLQAELIEEERIAKQKEEGRPQYLY